MFFPLLPCSITVSESHILPLPQNPALALETVEEDFAAEPTEYFFFKALKDGLQNGTMVIDDDNYKPDDYAEVDDDDGT